MIPTCGGKRGTRWALGRLGRRKLPVSALTGSLGGPGKGSAMPAGEGVGRGRAGAREGFLEEMTTQLFLKDEEELAGYRE